MSRKWLKTRAIDNIRMASIDPTGNIVNKAIKPNRLKKLTRFVGIKIYQRIVRTNNIGREVPATRFLNLLDSTLLAGSYFV